jgi:ketosteroid isomerase-like protein
MKTPTLLRLFLPLLLLLSAPTLRANDDAVISAVRAADDERVAATMAADPARMDAIFSDQLHYAHSSGKIDTKKSYVDSLLARSTVYTGYEYKQRDFLVAAPDVVLMTAHVIIKAGSPTAQNTNDLNILAVWRKEGGKWRFLAWQSCKNPPTVAPAAK